MKIDEVMDGGYLEAEFGSGNIKYRSKFEAIIERRRLQGLNLESDWGIIAGEVPKARSFNLWALLFPPFWALYHGLALGWVLVCALGAASAIQFVTDQDIFVPGTGIGIALYMGFWGNSLLLKRLLKKARAGVSAEATGYLLRPSIGRLVVGLALSLAISSSPVIFREYQLSTRLDPSSLPASYMPSTSSTAPQTPLATRISRILEDQVQCDTDPQPSKTILAMLDERSIRDTDTGEDGSEIYVPTKPFLMKGLRLQSLTGWEGDANGNAKLPFSRGPGAAPQTFIALTFAGSVADVQARFARHDEQDNENVDVRKTSETTSTITCFEHSSSTQTATATPPMTAEDGTCDVELDGHMIMNGSCSGEDDGKAAVFSSPHDGCTVTLSRTGDAATASLAAYKDICWVDEKSDRQVQDEMLLPPLKRDGRCWVGDGVRICSSVK